MDKLITQSGIIMRIPNTRSIVIGDEINSVSSMAIIIELLNLAHESDDDITLYINSPGGSVSDGLAIYDTMNLIKPRVSTICIGLAASMGAFLLSSGTKGMRYALPNSEIMIHQPLGGSALNQQTNIQIMADQLAKTRNNLEKILAKNTGKSVEQIHKDCERDKYMSAYEALKYGIIDKIIEPEEPKSIK